MLRFNGPDGKSDYFVRTNTNAPFSSVRSDVKGQVVQNPDNTYTLTFKDGRIHNFSPTGRLLWQKDRNGNQTTLGYDVNGALTAVTDAVGRTLTFTRYTDQLVISDSMGLVATYDYFKREGHHLGKTRRRREIRIRLLEFGRGESIHARKA